MWDPFFKIFRLLNSDQDPFHLSLGLTLAMVAGLTPLMSLHNLVVLLLVMVLRANISAFMFGLGSFTLLAYMLDPLFHSVGLYLLQLPSLSEMWTGMYNSSFWRLTRFNNTIVLGSLAVSVVALVPTFFLMRVLVELYRKHIQKRFAAATGRAQNLLRFGRLFSRIGSDG